MAPTLVARFIDNNQCDEFDDNCNNDAWLLWVRWVVLGVIIVGVLLIFFLFSCITARRRRRMGYQPYRGTGWALGRTPPGHAPATYNPQQYQANQAPQQPYYANNNGAYAPPAYTPNGAANDYYGQNRNDVELQRPPASHGGNNVYSPPPGSPPVKTDGIIR